MNQGPLPECRIVPSYIKHLRIQAEVGREELSLKLCKSRNYITMVESNWRSLGVLEFIRIAKLLEVDPKKAFADLLTAYDEAQADRAERKSDRIYLRE